MADKILIRAGNDPEKALGDRELGYCRKDKALYIGTPNGNVKLTGNSEGGGGGEIITTVNADWSQNDTTAPDYVKNRTHWKEEHKIEWDGSRDGRDSFDASAMGFGVCYKVSDEVWTKEQAETGFIRTVQANGEEVDRTDNCAVLLNDDAIGFAVSYIKYPFVQVVVFFAKQAADLTDVYGFSIPSAGCYFLDDGFAEDFGGVRLVLETPTVTHKLDYEYLPEDIATEAKVEEMISELLEAIANGTY